MRWYLTGLDKDLFVIETSRQRLENKNTSKCNFANSDFRNMKRICLENGIIVEVDGILLIQASSHQFDVAERDLAT